MSTERRSLPSWRALALAGAGTICALIARMLLTEAGHPDSPWRYLRSAVAGETKAEELERRLAAVEGQLQHLPPERVS